MTSIIRVAQSKDIRELEFFLGQADISTKGLNEQIGHFLLMEDHNGRIIGTLGIQRIEGDAMLRSLVITPEVEQTSILEMFQQILRLAREKEISRLYLATNKTGSIEFFTLLGFKRKELTEVPNHIRHSEHVEESLTIRDIVLMEFVF